MADSSSSQPPAVESPPGSPRRASISLQAAATMNASLQSDVSRGSSSGSPTRSRHSTVSNRRRSTVLMNLQLNDPSVPAPGEMITEGQGSANGMGSGPLSPRLSAEPPLMPSRDLSRGPHHNRTPSIGELHQELEEEQEAQVNRLLQMIRQQQLQLQQLQASQGHGGQSTEDTSAVSDRSAAQNSQVGSTATTSTLPINPGSSVSLSQSPRQHRPRSSFDMARADLSRRSRTPSRGPSLGTSPRLRATSIGADVGDGMTLSGRDESAFYQAETQMLVRENQMLRHRIRELEKQLAEAQAATSVPHEPSLPSHLSRTTSAKGEAELRGG